MFKFLMITSYYAIFQWAFEFTFQSLTLCQLQRSFQTPVIPYIILPEVRTELVHQKCVFNDMLLTTFGLQSPTPDSWISSASVTPLFR